jgi:hypothetical protein
VATLVSRCRRRNGKPAFQLGAAPRPLPDGRSEEHGPSGDIQVNGGNFILNVKREHSSWGARKIRERLVRWFPSIPIPAKSTIRVVLDRYGLVQCRGRVRRRAQGTALSLGQRPNELWCTDYKGEFLLGNRQYCYPLG